MSLEMFEKISYTIFGQSHSEKMGVVISGLPAGFAPDLKKLAEFMKRRAPGNDAFSTKRKEADEPHIVSGINPDGTLCGAPLCIMIDNKDQRSSDYEKLKALPRPSHADYAAYVKYGGYNDIRGGGQFSGRLTAPLCAAGGIAKQILEEKGISVSAHIYSVHGIKDRTFNPLEEEKELYKELEKKEFPVISNGAGEKMKAEILAARENLDSVGGSIECIITGIKAGKGSFGAESIESRISAAVFGIPAVKGIEFGCGFESEKLFGSEFNDEFYYDGEKNVKTYKNNNGGILGGISNGMPIIFRAAIKPTPSIAKKQRTVNLSAKENAELEIKGRHDPCIVQRAVPVMEAAAALVILDLI